MSGQHKIVEIPFVSYPVKDMKRAQAFYEGVMGLIPSYRSETPNGIWQEYDIGHGTLSLGEMQGWEPNVGGGCVGLEVEDFDATLAHLRSRDVPIVMGPIETPVCFIALVHDSEGNTITIHKRKGS